VVEVTIQSLSTYSKLQTTAASLTALAGVVVRAGVITAAYAAQGTVATSADEQMSIALTKDSGDTAVSTAVVLSSGNTNDVAVTLPILATGVAHVAVGDVLKIALTYTAGSAAVPQLDTIVTIEVTH